MRRATPSWAVRGGESCYYRAAPYQGWKILPRPAARRVGRHGIACSALEVHAAHGTLRSACPGRYKPHGGLPSLEPAAMLGVLPLVAALLNRAAYQAIRTRLIAVWVAAE